MDQLEFIRIMNYLAEAYGVTISQTRLNIYYDKLKTYDLNLLKQIASNIVAQDNYFPTVARLLALLNEELEPVLTADPMDEWLNVIDAIRKYGRTHADKGKNLLSDMTKSVVTTIGWTRLCDADQFALANYERQFKQLFRRQQGSVKERVLLSRGVIEPVTVGSELRALTVD